MNDEAHLSLIEYLRGLGFFADYAQHSSAEILEILRIPTELPNGDDLFFQDTIDSVSDEALFLLADWKRVWWTHYGIDILPDEDSYVEILSNLAAISRGAFNPQNITETWAEDESEITLSFELNGKQHELSPDANNHFDSLLVGEINDLIRESGRQFEQLSDDPIAYVCLTLEEKARLVSERGWIFEPSYKFTERFAWSGSNTYDLHRFLSPQTRFYMGRTFAQLGDVLRKAGCDETAIGSLCDYISYLKEVGAPPRSPLRLALDEFDAGIEPADETGESTLIGGAPQLVVATTRTGVPGLVTFPRNFDTFDGNPDDLPDPQPTRFPVRDFGLVREEYIILPSPVFPDLIVFHQYLVALIECAAVVAVNRMLSDCIRICKDFGMRNEQGNPELAAARSKISHISWRTYVSLSASAYAVKIRPIQYAARTQAEHLLFAAYEKALGQDMSAFSKDVTSTNEMALAEAVANSASKVSLEEQGWTSEAGLHFAGFILEDLLENVETLRALHKKFPRKPQD